MGDQRAFVIDRQQVAYLLDVDARSVTRWQQRPVDPLPIKTLGRGGRSSEYDPSAVLAWAVRQEVGKLKTDGDGRVIDLDSERARLAKEQADAAALKNHVTRREQIPAVILEAALSQLAGQVSALLDTIPSRIKNRMPELSATAIDFIRSEIVKCQNACSEARLDYDRLEEDAQ